jgi:hypothetical protein
MIADQIDGDRFAILHVRTSRIEVRVAQYYVSWLQEKLADYVFRRPALVRRNDVWISNNLANGSLESEEASRANVGFVPSHQASPLFIAHRAGAAVGRQIDENVG